MGFGAHEKLILRLCERHGWTLRDWWALDTAEQDTWMAWEHERQRQRREAIEGVIDRSKHDGKVYAETISAQALIALLAEMA